MFHLCDTCHGKITVREYLRTMFSSHEFVDVDTITYKQWLKTDRTTIETLIAKVEGFIHIATDAIYGLRQHHYVSKATLLCITDRRVTYRVPVFVSYVTA